MLLGSEPLLAKATQPSLVDELVTELGILPIETHPLAKGIAVTADGVGHQHDTAAAGGAEEAVAAAAVDIAHLKEYLTELICQATGGPCVYTGKHMDVVHAGLNITEEEFNRVVVNLSNALDKFNVPQKEKGELLAIVGSLKSKIVGL